MMLSSRLVRIGVLVLAGLLLLAAAWWFGRSAFDRWVEGRIQTRIEQAKGQTEALQKQADQERQALIAAKADAERARADARRYAQEASRLGAERQALLARVQSSAQALERIRRDVSAVPASELLAAVRRALAVLRAPLPRPGGGGPTDGGGAARGPRGT